MMRQLLLSCLFKLFLQLKDLPLMRIIDFDCEAFVKDSLQCVLFYHGVDPGLEGILVKESLLVLHELLNDHFR
jgi:hypothetical protein